MGYFLFQYLVTLNWRLRQTQADANWRWKQNRTQFDNFNTGCAENVVQNALEHPISVTRKNRQVFIKLPKNDFTRKMIDFKTFKKLCNLCGQFGQINCCHRLWKVCPKCNKLPNLVTLHPMNTLATYMRIRDFAIARLISKDMYSK